MFDLGRSLVIFTPAPLEFSLQESDGRNEASFGTFDLLPIEECETTVAAGENFRIFGRNVFESFWKDVSHLFQYSSYFKTPVGEPFLKVKGTDKVVAQYFRQEKGHLIFLPELKRDLSHTDVQILLTGIQYLVQALEKESDESSLPEWAHSVSLPGENNERAQLQILNAQQSEIEIR